MGRRLKWLLIILLWVALTKLRWRAKKRGEGPPPVLLRLHRDRGALGFAEVGAQFINFRLKLRDALELDLKLVLSFDEIGR